VSDAQFDFAVSIRRAEHGGRKLDLIVLAVIMLGLVWIEHEHCVMIGWLAAAETVPLAASACPDNDSVPFSADCIAFIGGEPR
jgi:hypothetical protein